MSAIACSRRVLESVLIAARPAADDVPDAGEEVAEDVDADDRLSGHDTEVIDNAAAFHLIGRRDDHEYSP